MTDQKDHENHVRQGRIVITFARAQNAAFVLALTAVAAGILVVPDGDDLTAAFIAIGLITIGFLMPLIEKVAQRKSAQSLGDQS